MPVDVQVGFRVTQRVDGRLVQTEVGDQLARMLLAGKVHDGDTVLVDQTGGEHLELSAWASDQIVSDNPDVSVDNVTEDK